MLEYYAQRAAEYERIYDKPERQSDLEQLRSRLAREVAGLRVMELACGTGYWTQVMAQTAEFILATDHNLEVLEVAAEKHLPAERVGWARTDAWRLPAMAGEFGAVFAGFWWSHVPRQKLALFLAGVNRAVGPGVKVLFLDNRFVTGSSTPIARTDALGNTWQMRSLDDGSQHEIVKNFPDADELRAAVDGNGGDVRVIELPHYWVLSYVSN